MLSSIKSAAWVVIVLLFLAALALVYFGLPKGEQTDETVKVGSILRTARATGRVEGLCEMTLSFGRAGMVDRVNVSEGQEVELNGDTPPLAELNPTEADLQIAQGAAVLKEAEAKLELARIPRSPEALQQAEEKLTQASEEVKACALKLKVLQEPPVPKTLPWQLEDAGRSVEKATQNLALAKAALEQLKAMPTADELNVALAHVNTAKAELDGAEKVFTEFKGGFTTPSTSKTQLEVKVEVARKNLEKAQAEYDQVKRGPPPQAIEAAQARVALAQNELDGAHAAKRRLEKPDAPPPAPEASIEEARIALRQAQSKERQAKAALEELKRPPLEADVAVAEAGRERAEKALTLTKLFRDALKLRAPFSGLVTKRFVQPGSLVEAGQPILSMLDFSQKRVRAEFDIARLPALKAGMSVSLTSQPLLEKGGPEGEGPKSELTGWPLTGKIEKILGVGSRKLLLDDPTAPKGGEVFEVLIAVEPPKTELKQKSYALLRQGLRVVVEAVLDERKDVLVIPKSYIKWEEEPGANGELVVRPFVWRLVNGAPGKAERWPVKCGSKDDLSQEIIEGLSKGDRIVKPQPNSGR